MVPHADRLTDAELLAAFESTRLGNGEFRHREHVRAAFACLAKHGDFARAAWHFRRSLRRFAAAHGAPGRYHETVTWAYLALINERMRASAVASSAQLLARFPELLEGGALLARYYDVDALLRSPAARDVFILPERK
jgi:hypothetical protein